MSEAFRLARRCWRVTVALVKFAKGHVPKWMVPLAGVALATPLPFDDVVVLAVVLWPVLRSQASRRELAGSVRKAWRN